MQEERATEVVDKLRARGLMAHLQRSGVFQFGVRIVIPGGREAIWDSDGAAGLEATIMRNGQLVGFVPTIAGSETYDVDQTVEAIARTDYEGLG